MLSSKYLIATGKYKQRTKILDIEYLDAILFEHIS